ncbi:MBL fold metallo-hydrolase [uncultured Mucilaginibacter sp.]|uniref:MBL fold metallo-hydrolase n=1 Tax=uncultured Mucilaginibacter sp. TaxID=797541 RepID=UPI0025CDA62D|nr:MBL fold metallo-hydrolase [uncultured Mucilaginibacter sp.]
MEIFALGEGSYSVDSSKQFIPFDPATDNAKDRPGSLFIHVNPFLVKTDRDLIVLDSGLGMKDSSGELIIHQNIRKAGFAPGEVTLVLQSHLHYDHTGGLVVERNGKLEPSFPQATHVINKGEWEVAMSGKSSSYRKPIFEALEREAKIEFVEGNGEVRPGIHFELSGGHTQYHQVFLIENNGQKCFFGGDELPEPEQLLRKFAAKYDYDGKRAMHLREEYGTKASAENWACLFYHAKSTAIGYVSQQDDTFSIKPY